MAIFCGFCGCNVYDADRRSRSPLVIKRKYKKNGKFAHVWDACSKKYFNLEKSLLSKSFRLRCELTLLKSHMRYINWFSLCNSTKLSSRKSSENSPMLMRRAAESREMWLSPVIQATGRQEQWDGMRWRDLYKSTDGFLWPHYRWLPIDRARKLPKKPVDKNCLVWLFHPSLPRGQGFEPQAK
jgi:hypothetical protein